MAKIYIAGKIGKAGVTAMRGRFDSAAALLRETGWETVNPCDLAANADSWESAMIIDLHALLDCDAVYALSNWKSSPGATIEIQLALRLRKVVIFEDEENVCARVCLACAQVESGTKPYLAQNL